MSEVLSQSEIDALVASLTMNAPMTGKVEHKDALTSGPKPYDFRDSRKLPERYLKGMFELHERFCRRFEDILSNLRVGPVKLNVDSIEERLSPSSSGRKEPGVVSQFVSLNPLPYRAGVRFDHQFVLSVLDAMLGGRAEGPYDTRKLTVLEKRLFDRVLAALADTLAASWRSAAMIESALLPSDVTSYISSDETSSSHREASVVTVLLRAEVGRTSGFVELTIPWPAVATAMEEGQPPRETLTDAERDAIGEISNISFGAAATVLSTLLSQRVEITTPEVTVCLAADVRNGFAKQSVVVSVEYSAGLSGVNALVLELDDAKVIADLMMGGDGSAILEELTELHLSALAEAMNQMMGGAATAMSAMFGRSINLTPPSVRCVDFRSREAEQLCGSEWFVSIGFRLRVGRLIDSRLTQWIPLEFAKNLLRFVQPELDTLGSSASPRVEPVTVHKNLGLLLT